MNWLECECSHWARMSGPLTNHHPQCSHFNDSLMDVWVARLGKQACYAETEAELKDMIGDEQDESDKPTISQEKMHRELFENLKEFDGF